MELIIKEIREKEGLTQQELSEKAGVSRAIISNLETKKEAITTTSTLEKIAKALNKKVSDLFYDVDV